MPLLPASSTTAVGPAVGEAATLHGERSVIDRVTSRRMSDISGAADVAASIAHSFHREHLFAACFFVETARKLEACGVTDGGSDDLAKHRACVSGAIFSSVAFLESSINELYLEFQHAGHNGMSRLPKRAHALLAKLWPPVEFSPLMLRYQVALQAADAERFNERRPPFRDVENLMRLHDALVHHQPERHHERWRHQSLQRRLRNKFAPNTLLPVRALWFPDLCLGHGCAEWALRTAEVFSDDVCRRLSIPSRGRASCEVPGRRRVSPERVSAPVVGGRKAVRPKPAAPRRPAAAHHR